MSEAVIPVDAATLIVLRDPPEGSKSSEFSVFCVQRTQSASFMGGAVVFPGGRVEDADRDPRWASNVTPPVLEDWRAFAIAACRETLEEAAILPLAAGGAPLAAPDFQPSLSDDELMALRRELATVDLRAWLAARDLRLDLGALRPLSRWLTPTNQKKRFDTRFFVVRAPAGQEGAHDERETIASFWATPSQVLARFDAGAIELTPPTHRTLSFLAAHANVDEVFESASSASKAVICPEVVRHVDARGETVALTLPGDPEHSVRETLVAGPSRFVLRNGVFRPEAAPSPLP